MTCIRQELAPAPHLLDPAETVKSAQVYARSWSVKELAETIAEHTRAIEHEQAVFEGFRLELERRMA